MLGPWSDLVPFLYAASGGIVLIPLAATGLAFRRRTFLLVALGLGIAAALLNIALNFSHRSEFAFYRDIVALALFALACPIVSATLVVGRGSALSRAGVAAAVVGVSIIVAPFLLLFVHCTSGDCL